MWQKEDFHSYITIQSICATLSNVPTKMLRPSAATCVCNSHFQLLNYQRLRQQIPNPYHHLRHDIGH